MTMKKAKAAHTQKILPTTLPNVKVKVNCQRYTDGSYRLAGQLIDAKTLLRLDADIRMTMKVSSEAQLEIKERHLVGRLCDAYNTAVAETNRRNAKQPVNSERLYSEAFETLTKDQYALLYPPSYVAESSRKNMLSYFRSTYLPMLDRYGRDIDATERMEIFEALCQHAQNHGNFAGKPESALQRGRVHASYLNRMYRAMRALLPEYDLPEIELPIPGAAKAVQNEQIKALANDVCVKFASFLQRLPENGLAVGAALMLTGMARTAEACAPLWGDIVYYDTYAVYGVLWQGQACERCDILKSTASYRPMILPKFTVDLLRARIAWLLARGYTPEEIAAMPVCSTCDDPRRPAEPASLSAFVRELLSLLGCTKSYWAAVDTAIFNEPDINADNGIPLRDPSAYVLRRNCCSLCCNVCGMDPDLVDALMGHKLRKDCKTQWDRYIRRPDNWAKIAALLERVVWDPRHSANPAFAPVQLTTEQTYVSPCAQIRFALQAPVGSDTQKYTVFYEVETAEEGDSIVLRAPGKMKTPEVSPNRFGGKYKPIIGNVGMEDYYLDLIRQAEDIDLSKFLPTTVRKAEPADTATSPNPDLIGGNSCESESSPR